MELTKRAIMVGLLAASLVFASASEEIIVQPGYEQPSSTSENLDVNTPREIIVQPSYEPSSLDAENSQNNSARNIIVQPDSARTNRMVGSSQINSPRNIPLYPGYERHNPMTGSPQVNSPGNIPLYHTYVQPSYSVVNPQYQPFYGQENLRILVTPQGNYMTYLQKQSTLNDEIQHNQNVQRPLANQLQSMGYTGQANTIEQLTREPDSDNPIRAPWYFKFNPHYPTPYALQGFNKKKCSWGCIPLTMQAARINQNCAGRIQILSPYSRFLDDKSGIDAGVNKVNKVHALAACPSVVQSNPGELVDAPAMDDAQADGSIGKEQKIMDAIFPIVGDFGYGEKQHNPGYSLITTPFSSQSLKMYDNDRSPQMIKTPSANYPGMGKNKYLSTGTYKRHQNGYQPVYQYDYQPYYQPAYRSDYQENYGRTPIGSNQSPNYNAGSFSFASSNPSVSTSSGKSFPSRNNNYN